MTLHLYDLYGIFSSMDEFVRLERLIGKENAEKIASSKVLICGVGGVGGYVAEGLARCGIGKLGIVDCDFVSISNINRQIIALHSTIGKLKVDVLKDRLIDINPNIIVKTYPIFINNESISILELVKYDYIVDAIDCVPSKILLIENAKQHNINIISCMGTGNRLDLSKFIITDIEKTKICPLAAKMRRELKKRGISNVKVLYSESDIIKQTQDENGKITPASISTVPPVAGLTIANYIISCIIN